MDKALGWGLGRQQGRRVSTLEAGSLNTVWNKAFPGPGISKTHSEAGPGGHWEVQAELGRQGVGGEGCQRFTQPQGKAERWDPGG